MPTKDASVAKPTVADAARNFLSHQRATSEGGLCATDCDELDELVGAAADESRILAKSASAMSVALAAAKEVLLRCRAPEGDRATYDERQRVLGMIEDMLRGHTQTEGLRVRWLALAVARTFKNRRGATSPRSPVVIFPSGRREE